MIASVIIILLNAANVEPIILPNVIGFDLAKVPLRTDSCFDSSPSADIVVCAPKGAAIWINNTGDFKAKPVRLTFNGPLNAETTFHVIQHQSPTTVTPAAAVTFKWHF